MNFSTHHVFCHHISLRGVNYFRISSLGLLSLRLSFLLLGLKILWWRSSCYWMSLLFMTHAPNKVKNAFVNVLWRDYGPTVKGEKEKWSSILMAVYYAFILILKNITSIPVTRTIVSVTDKRLVFFSYNETTLKSVTIIAAKWRNNFKINDNY